VKIRVDPADLERWRKAAQADVVSLSTFIRDSVNLRLAGASRPVFSDATLRANGEQRGELDSLSREELEQRTRPKARRNVAATARTCDRRAFHRSGVYCKTCGATPA